MLKYVLPFFVASAGAVSAHEGHEEAVLQGDTHWLTQGDHIIVVALGIIGLSILVRRIVTKRKNPAPKEA